MMSAHRAIMIFPIVTPATVSQLDRSVYRATVKDSASAKIILMEKNVMSAKKDSTTILTVKNATAIRLEFFQHSWAVVVFKQAANFASAKRGLPGESATNANRFTGT